MTAGAHEAVIELVMDGDRFRSPADLTISLDGVPTARVPRTTPSLFTYSETFDVGCDLGSPVSLAYADRKPFAYTGTIDTVVCRYLDRAEPAGT